MSEFNVSNTVSMTAEEAQEVLRAAFVDTSVESSAEHTMLVDAVKYLILGGFTYDQIAGNAISMAKQDNDYSMGRVFDVFTNQNLEYGRKLVEVATRIQPSDIVTPSMAYSGKYNRSRTQFIINSGLLTDKKGRQYYEVLRQRQYVTSGIVTAIEQYEKLNGAELRIKLYVKDLAQQKFYMLPETGATKNRAIALGSPVVYDTVLNHVQASGVINTYSEALNKLSQETVEEMAEDQKKLFQQMLFLETFKSIKNNL